MAGEGLPVQMASRVLLVSESGYYRWQRRPPSARSVRHAWLTEIIQAVHIEARGVYGARRVHAELRLGRGITVSHGQVELLMVRAGLKEARLFSGDRGGELNYRCSTSRSSAPAKR